MSGRRPARLLGLATGAGLALAVVAGLGSPARATNYPGFITMITDSMLVLSVPQVGKPAYLAPIVDPVFGTRVTRIAGEPGTSTAPVSGTWGTDVRHMYSKMQPWNSDNTMITIQNRDGGSPSNLILDGNTYQPRLGPCSGYGASDFRWHPSTAHPNEQVNVNGSELMWYDVVNCTKTRTWPLPFSVNGIGSGEGNPSNDGRYVALASGTHMFVVDMDPQPPFAPYPNRRIGPAYDISSCGLANGCGIDWVSMSASGTYAVVTYASGREPRVFDVNPTTLALTPRSMPASSPRCSGGAASQGFIYDVSHADFAMNPFDNNEDYLVGRENCGNGALGGVVMVRLRDGVVTSLTEPGNEAYPHHVSTRNIDRPGWAYANFYHDLGTRFDDEVIAVKLDGSGAVQRFAHKHGNFSGCYRCESHAVPSRDGRRVIFASNWAQDCGGQCGPTNVKQDYVIDARPTVDTVPPARVSDLRVP